MVVYTVYKIHAQNKNYLIKDNQCTDTCCKNLEKRLAVVETANMINMCYFTIMVSIKKQNLKLDAS